MVEMREEGDRLRVCGDLTFETVAAIARKERRWKEQSPTVDLGAVSACDSAGLALLIDWRRRARREGVELVYRNVPDRLLKLARISEVDSLLA